MAAMAEDEASDGTLRLRDEFPPVSTADWEAAIREDLNGADYEERLVWRTEEGISVRPYYRRQDLEALDPQTSADPGAFPYVRGPGTQAWEPLDASVEPTEGAIRADLMHDAGADAVQEVGYAIAAGTEKLKQSIEEGNTVDASSSSIVFVFAVGSNFFMEIAKLRAARLLWARVIAEFEPHSEISCLMNLHVRTAVSNKHCHDQHMNLLRATTEALSAVIGGCASLQVRPSQFPDRLGTNLQRILKDEAHLDHVADPAGGSYYVEALTDSLSKRAWELFRRVESAGGYTNTLEAIELEIGRARSAKQEADTQYGEQADASSCESDCGEGPKTSRSL